MGISATDIEILIHLKERGHLKAGDSVIEIGAQQCSNEFLRAKVRLKRIGDLFGASGNCPIPDPLYTDVINGYETLPEKAPPSHIFWRWLGLKYRSIDIDHSHDSFFLDLNFDSVPKKEKGKYNLVTNFGTTEHIANQLNAFKIIHELTQEKGIMVHHLPTQGMINHGLLNYNPKFFWMLARSNQYDWLYFDYTCNKVYYELPENVIDQIDKYATGIHERKKEYKMADSTLIVVLQKVKKLPFVPPIDINTGTVTNNKKLKKRYWSVFE